MTAWYNEIDPFAAAWLRNLITEGLIADGIVDERSIADVRPADLIGFTQCHFFAGIGGWSYALRLAEWPDDRPVWTGSCPCQPFSDAGKGGGFDDARHLWPDFFRLISQCRPAVVFGEQVASKDGLAWLDLVQADMEGKGYAFGAVDSCAAGFGAPHIRQRLYWVADANTSQWRADMARRNNADRHSTGRNQGNGESGEYREARQLAYADEQRYDGSRSRGAGWDQPSHGSTTGIVADADGRDASAERQQRGGEQRQQPQDGGAGELGDTNRQSGQRRAGSISGAQAPFDRENRPQHGHQPDRPEHAGESVRELADAHHQRPQGRASSAQRPDQRAVGQIGVAGRPGPTNGHWRDADWLGCTDGRWRPVEPGTFPLSHGVPNRVGALRGYGNAIVAPQAAEFVAAYRESRGVIAESEAA